ncbi:hypothetical protein [Mycolicibacter virginiensis]|uniref:hypothetical protein n=1 Tax=Mycolicibacter virginiensis TaxID=1795032 RepID=UPI001F047939|nr:hypothetical protein [Mycolicibacter virginiensis]ULP48043.1 hypothetical protein MJO54_02405 [Mycolicibacter virginiensis]
MNPEPNLTSADYQELADPYEREPPRRDERIGEPVIDIGAPMRRRAEERLQRIADIRTVSRLSAAGKDPDEIAAELQLAEPLVDRLLRSAGVVIDVEGSPEELILRAYLDGSPREQLIDQLSRYRYTFPEYAPFPHEGKTHSTWDHVEAAAVAGFISVEEFLQVHAAVNPPAPGA